MQLVLRLESIICFLLISILWSTSIADLKAQAQTSLKKEDTYSNPVIRGDIADPSLIRVADTYYATGTSSEWAPHYPLFQSKDLINWQQMGYVFESAPEWMQSSFWAPELFYHNHTFYVYYTVKRKSDGKSCIGVATTKDIRKAFTDHGIVVEYGSEAIDAYIFNDDGQLYISWKAYGLEKRPIEILACKLSADGLKLEGKPFTLLKENENEKGIEGQCLVKKNDFYYLLYSAGGCCGRECSYNVRIARAKSIDKGFVRYENNPLLKENEGWMCPGHGTLVETADKRTFYMYHAYNTNDHVYTGRQAMLDELIWDDISGWPYFQQGRSPSIRRNIPLKKTRQIITNEVYDNFDASTLSSSWQWNFRSYTPVTKLEKGNLYLSGKIHPTNQSGIALTVRPLKGNYQISTQVVNNNLSWKGLVLYGDSSQAVGISVKADKVAIWEIKNNQRKVLAEEPLSKQVPLHLKMLIENGFMCRFYWSRDGKNWKQLKPLGSEQTFYDGSYLPQWDRSARAGLIHFGDESQPAAFSFFSIKYNTTLK